MSVAPAIAELAAALGARARPNESLARHTTLRIGGPADLWIEAHTLVELVESVTRARERAIPVFILGNGSNLLVLDGGIRGLVIENHCNQFRLNVTNDKQAILRVESGAALPLIANQLARQGWSGLEWAVGVPGTVGGAVAGNAGAHAGCIADRLLTVSILDEAGQVIELPKTDLGFEYRQSRLKHSRGEIVLGADFEMTRDDPQACIARMNQYTEHRRRTQPTEASVGSMFKNPPGDYAGRLIEQAGLKGTRVGNVEVSPVHANFFVNHGGATATDVVQLIEIVKDRVARKFGVELELEIEIVGDKAAA
ncbi:MAG: UDP-N-acetylmuramate dehydrogenase [Chloroflexi bacterium]|nr:UDP-N-acetylmuramate dehydrogenase [Chloroflexota bacterium]